MFPTNSNVNVARTVKAFSEDAVTVTKSIQRLQIDKEISTLALSRSQTRLPKAFSTSRRKASDIKASRSPKKQKNTKKEANREVRWSQKYPSFDNFEPQMLSSLLGLGKMSQGMSDVSSLAEKINGLLSQESLDSLKNTTFNVEKASEIFSSIDPKLIEEALLAPSNLVHSIENLVGILKDSKDSLGTIALWLSISMFLYWSHNKDSKYLMAAIVLAVIALSLSGMPTQLLQWLIKLSSFNTPDDLVEPQMSVHDINQFAGIGLSILALLVGFQDKHLNIPKLAWEFLDKRERMTRSLSSCLTSILDFIEYLLNKCSASFGTKKMFSFMQSGIGKVDDYLLQVDTFKQSVESGKMMFTQTTYDRLIQMVKDGETLLRGLPREDSTMQIVSILRSRLLWLEKKRVEFSSSSFTNDGMRPEPVHIMLRGPPGTGKSQLIAFLFQALCAASLPAELLEEFNKNPAKFMYERQMEAEYWDGYCCFSWVTLFDDLGQIRDVIGSPDGEWMNLIRCKNSFPYRLHMAKIEDKSNTYFISRFIISTTNHMEEFPIESITNRDAIKRRIDFDVEVHFKPEHLDTNGKLPQFDIDSLPKNEEGHPVYTENVPLLLLREDKTTERRIVQISFEELVGMTLEKHAIQERVYQDKMQEWKRIRETYSPDLGFHRVPPGRGHYKHATDPMYKGVHMVSLEDLSEEDDEYYESQMDTHFDGYGEYRFTISPRTRMLMCTLEGMDETLTALEDKNGLGDRAHKALIVHRLYEIGLVLDEDYAICFSTHRDIRALYSFFSVFGVQTLALLQEPDETIWFESFSKWIESEGKLTDLPMSMPRPTTPLPTYTYRERLTNWFDQFKLTWIYKVSTWLERNKAMLPMISFFTTFFVGKAIIYYRSRSKLSAESKAAIEKLDHSEVKTQSMGHSDSMKQVNDSRQRLALLKAKLTPSQPQMAQQYDQYTWKRSRAILNANCYEFHLQEHNGMIRRAGFVTFVCGRIAICPAHFITNMLQGVEEYPEMIDFKVKLINRMCQERIITCTFRDILYDSNCDFERYDLASFQLPKHLISEHKDITDAFMQDRLFSAMTNRSVMLPEPTPEGVPHSTEAVMIENLPTNYGLKTIQRCFVYQGPFTVGDCGIPMFLLHGNSSWGCIGGIHVAGLTEARKGVSCAVTRSMIENIISQHVSVILPSDPIEGLPEQQMKQEDVPERFAFIRTVDKPILVAGSSEITRSPLHCGWGMSKTVPSKTYPHHLPTGEFIDPFDLALSKYCIPGPTGMRIDVLQQCADSFEEHLFNISTVNVERRLFTFEEAVLGIEGHEHFTSIKRSTSPGYPFIHLPLYEGKAKFGIFGEEQEYDMDNPVVDDLRRRVGNMITQAAMGIRSEIIFTDNLKDERLPIAKVAEGKARLFSGAALDYLIAFRMHFGAFCEWYTANHTVNGSAVGLNPYSTDWHLLATSLDSKANGEPNIGAGDFSRFDGSELPIVHDMILEIINNWYEEIYSGEIDPDARMIRTILWKELTNSKHIRGDVIYAWPSSLPSGHPITTIVNCMYNHIAFRYCWYRMCEEHGVSDYVEDAWDAYVKHVYLCVMGDDNIFAVSDVFKYVFTEATIAPWMAEIGLTYTSETKDVLHVALRNLEDVEFLKRSFRYDEVDRLWQAPLRLDVVLEIPYWIRKSPLTRHRAVDDNVQKSLDELSLHGKEVWDTWAPLIKQTYYQRCNRVPKHHKYASCKNAILSRKDWY
jgi:hypothetical protein